MQREWRRLAISGMGWRKTWVSEVEPYLLVAGAAGCPETDIDAKRATAAHRKAGAVGGHRTKRDWMASSARITARARYAAPIHLITAVPAAATVDRRLHGERHDLTPMPVWHASAERIGSPSHPRGANSTRVHDSRATTRRKAQPFKSAGANPDRQDGADQQQCCHSQRPPAFAFRPEHRGDDGTDQRDAYPDPFHFHVAPFPSLEAPVSRFARRAGTNRSTIVLTSRSM